MFATRSTVSLCACFAVVNATCQVSTWDNNGNPNLVSPNFSAPNWWNICPISTAVVQVCASSGSLARVMSGCHGDGNEIGFVEGPTCTTWGSSADGAASVGHDIGSILCV